MDDVAYARRVLGETSGLPDPSRESYVDRLGDSDLAQIADLLLARRPATEREPPLGEGVLRRGLEGLVREAAESGRSIAQLWYWPRPNPFAVAVTHDVDEVLWSWRRRLLMAVRHPGSMGSHGRAYWNFERVMAYERSLGIRSSFYAVPYGDHPRDPPYSLESVAAPLRALVAGGWEVGLHGSFTSYNRPDMLADEKRALERALGSRVTGVRQHFVNFEAPETWRIQERAGFLYDSTLASRERAGFRVGFCHPYRPDGRKILEIPLAVMDGQLFWYEHLDRERAVGRTMDILRETSEAGGVACLNWHQHTMDSLSFPEWWDVLRRCLDALRGMDPWFARADEVARWWDRRSRVGFREVGPDAWEITAADPGPLTVKIRGGPSESMKAEVDGAPGHATLEREGCHWVHLPDPPVGSPVRVVVRRG